MEQKISFASDYTRTAHPKILQRLMDMGPEQNVGYGTDDICESAAARIKDACGCPGADVFFLVGGTQTNQTIIDMLLEPYEGVVAARTGHIAQHEAGAIEHAGHKVLVVDCTGDEDQKASGGECGVVSKNIGKLTGKAIDELVTLHNIDDSREHMVFPGAVYISHPTEYGTLYSKEELKQISEVCHKHDIPLFLDGARLGYGLMSRETDVTLKDIAELTDVFYIGGTKVGAMFGEAVVFPKGVPTKHPVPIIKQHGALLAKGFLLGVQFDTLFTDNLYFDISRNAIDMAEKLKEGLKAKGYEFFLATPTNQQFIIVDDEKLKELEKTVGYSWWEKYDDTHTVIRLATDWATTKEEISALMEYL